MKRRLGVVIDVGLLCASVLVVSDIAWRYHGAFLNLFGWRVAAQGVAAAAAGNRAPTRSCLAPEQNISVRVQGGGLATVQSGLPATQIGWLSRTGYQQADRTVALVLRKGCHFCEASMPFYRHLNEARQHKPFRLVVVTADPIDTFRQYLQEQSISVDSIVNVAPNGLQVRGTPTLLMLDRAGRIRQFRTGQLPDQEQAKVLQELGAGT
jgi:hypothetical protein